ncbi:COP9 signalosome complex subunit 5 [Monosporozyma servazzii]
MADNEGKLRLSDQSVSYLNKLIRKDYIVEQQLHKDRDFNRRFYQSRTLSSSSSIICNPLNQYGQNQPSDWKYSFHSNTSNIEDQLARDTANITQQQIIQICQGKTNHNPYTSNTEQNVTSHLVQEMNRTAEGSNMYHYSHVLISRLATQQILNHAVKGNEIEIMGILLGVTLNHKFIITRSFPLPVEGTETRVNAQSESYEYMVQYVNEMIENGDIKTNERVVGWYHSHPGYDCWLSSIDMRTQDLNQSFQDPYVAIVVDPLKSLQEKSISIGAFRTIRNIKVGDDGSNEDYELSFYQLEMNVYDSELNKCLDQLKLSFKFDINEHNRKNRMAYELTKSLVESMKQIQTIGTMREELHLDSTSGIMADNSNRNILSCQNFRTSTTSNTSRAHQNRDMTPLNKSIDASSVSLNSLSNISDVETMHNEIDIDMESVNSSVHTGVETGIDIDITSTVQQGVFRSPHYNALLQQNMEQSGLEPLILNRNGLVLPTSTNTNIHTNTSHRDSTSSFLDTTAVAIEKEHEFSSYMNIKKTLLRLKMQEYKNLRLYRDAFTL